jgi:hypothetical protein
MPSRKPAEAATSKTNLLSSSAAFLLGLLFSPEDGGIMFLKTSVCV